MAARRGANRPVTYIALIAAVIVAFYTQDIVGSRVEGTGCGPDGDWCGPDHTALQFTGDGSSSRWHTDYHAALSGPFTVAARIKLLPGQDQRRTHVIFSQTTNRGGGVVPQPVMYYLGIRDRRIEFSPGTSKVCSHVPEGHAAIVHCPFNQKVRNQGVNALGQCDANQWLDGGMYGIQTSGCGHLGTAIEMRPNGCHSFNWGNAAEAGCRKSLVGVGMINQVHGDPCRGTTKTGGIIGTCDQPMSNRQLDIGRWYQIAATWDGWTIKLYIDGNLDSSFAYGIGQGPVWQHNFPMPLFLGYAPNDRYFREFNGMIRDFRIFKHAASASQLLSQRCLFNGAGAYIHIKFDEGSGHVISSNLGTVTRVHGTTRWVSLAQPCPGGKCVLPDPLRNFACACYSADEPNVDDYCQTCKPATDLYAWIRAPNSCSADEACHVDGTVNPNNQCEGCDVSNNILDWTDYDNRGCSSSPSSCFNTSHCEFGECTDAFGLHKVRQGTTIPNLRQSPFPTLAMDFTVTSTNGANVFNLGFFDSLTDLSGDFEVTMYNSDDGSVVAQESFTPSSPGRYIGTVRHGSPTVPSVGRTRVRDLPFPIELKPGFRGTIVVKGYDSRHLVQLTESKFFDPASCASLQERQDHPELQIDEFIALGRVRVGGASHGLNDLQYLNPPSRTFCNAANNPVIAMFTREFTYGTPLLGWNHLTLAPRGPLGPGLSPNTYSQTVYVGAGSPGIDEDGIPRTPGYNFGSNGTFYGGAGDLENTADSSLVFSFTLSRRNYPPAQQTCTNVSSVVEEMVTVGNVTQLENVTRYEEVCDYPPEELDPSAPFRLVDGAITADASVTITITVDGLVKGTSTGSADSGLTFDADLGSLKKGANILVHITASNPTSSLPTISYANFDFAIVRVRPDTTVAVVAAFQDQFIPFSPPAQWGYLHGAPYVSPSRDTALATGVSAFRQLPFDAATKVYEDAATGLKVGDTALVVGPELFITYAVGSDFATQALAARLSFYCATFTNETSTLTITALVDGVAQGVTGVFDCGSSAAPVHFEWDAIVPSFTGGSTYYLSFATEDGTLTSLTAFSLVFEVPVTEITAPFFKVGEETGCVINDACYENGAINPDNECQKCDTVFSFNSWTSAYQRVCTTCDEDKCVCSFAGECVAGEPDLGPPSNVVDEIQPVEIQSCDDCDASGVGSDYFSSPDNPLNAVQTACAAGFVTQLEDAIGPVTFSIQFPADDNAIIFIDGFTSPQKAKDIYHLLLEPFGLWGIHPSLFNQTAIHEGIVTNMRLHINLDANLCKVREMPMFIQAAAPIGLDCALVAEPENNEPDTDSYVAQFPNFQVDVTDEVKHFLEGDVNVVTPPQFRSGALVQFDLLQQTTTISGTVDAFKLAFETKLSVANIVSEGWVIDTQAKLLTSIPSLKAYARSIDEARFDAFDQATDYALVKNSFTLDRMVVTFTDGFELIWRGGQDSKLVVIRGTLVLTDLSFVLRAAESEARYAEFRQCTNSFLFRGVHNVLGDRGEIEVGLATSALGSTNPNNPAPQSAVTNPQLIARARYNSLGLLTWTSFFADQAQNEVLEKALNVPHIGPVWREILGGLNGGGGAFTGTFIPYPTESPAGFVGSLPAPREFLMKLQSAGGRQELIVGSLGKLDTKVYAFQTRVRLDEAVSFVGDVAFAAIIGLKLGIKATENAFEIIGDFFNPPNATIPPPPPPPSSNGTSIEDVRDAVSNITDSLRFSGGILGSLSYYDPTENPGLQWETTLPSGRVTPGFAVRLGVESPVNCATTIGFYDSACTLLKGLVGLNDPGIFVVSFVDTAFVGWRLEVLAKDLDPSLLKPLLGETGSIKNFILSFSSEMTYIPFLKQSFILAIQGTIAANFFPFSATPLEIILKAELDIPIHLQLPTNTPSLALSGLIDGYFSFMNKLYVGNLFLGGSIGGDLPLELQMGAQILLGNQCVLPSGIRNIRTRCIEADVSLGIFPLFLNAELRDVTLKTLFESWFGESETLPASLLNIGAREPIILQIAVDAVTDQFTGEDLAPGLNLRINLNVLGVRTTWELTYLFPSEILRTIRDLRNGESGLNNGPFTNPRAVLDAALRRIEKLATDVYLEGKGVFQIDHPVTIGFDIPGVSGTWGVQVCRNLDCKPDEGPTLQSWDIYLFGRLIYRQWSGAGAIRLFPGTAVEDNVQAEFFISRFAVKLKFTKQVFGLVDFRFEFTTVGALFLGPLFARTVFVAEIEALGLLQSIFSAVNAFVNTLTDVFTAPLKYFGILKQEEIDFMKNCLKFSWNNVRFKGVVNPFLFLGTGFTLELDFEIFAVRVLADIDFSLEKLFTRPIETFNALAKPVFDLVSKPRKAFGRAQCNPQYDSIGDFCHLKCPDGYERLAGSLVCFEKCPSGFTRVGLSCFQMSFTPARSKSIKIGFKRIRIPCIGGCPPGYGKVFPCTCGRILATWAGKISMRGFYPVDVPRYCAQGTLDVPPILKDFFTVKDIIPMCYESCEATYAQPGNANIDSYEAAWDKCFTLSAFSCWSFLGGIGNPIEELKRRMKAASEKALDDLEYAAMAPFRAYQTTTRAISGANPF